jgi:hypothetical protein
MGMWYAFGFGQMIPGRTTVGCASGRSVKYATTIGAIDVPSM